MCHVPINCSFVPFWPEGQIAREAGKTRVALAQRAEANRRLRAFACAAAFDTIIVHGARLDGAVGAAEAEETRALAIVAAAATAAAHCAVLLVHGARRLACGTGEAIRAHALARERIALTTVGAFARARLLPVANFAVVAGTALADPGDATAVAEAVAGALELEFTAVHRAQAPLAHLVLLLARPAEKGSDAAAGARGSIARAPGHTGALRAVGITGAWLQQHSNSSLQCTGG